MEESNKEALQKHIIMNVNSLFALGANIFLICNFLVSTPFLKCLVFLSFFFFTCMGSENGKQEFDTRPVGVFVLLKLECKFSAWFPLWKTNRMWHWLLGGPNTNHL